MFYPKCGSEYESGHIFCANCGTRLSEGHGQGQGHDQSNMVIWFDDYLNWTLVLAMVAITVFFVVVAGVTASVSSDSDAAAVNGGVMLLCIALSMVVGAWVLRQKGRSLWWVHSCDQSRLFPSKLKLGMIGRCGRIPLGQIEDEVVDVLYEVW